MKLILISLILIAGMLSCTSYDKPLEEKVVKLVTLDPGHFHAALVQKIMYGDIDTNVYVYAPEGDDITEHLKRIKNYNTRTEKPTAWNEIVYRGPDFLSKMLTEKKGNVVVLAGNNREKTGYIKESIKAGLNVLADKPMSINMEDFELLKESFDLAGEKNLLLYDMMTERSEITTILQKEFSLDKDLFGTLEKGSSDNPAVTKESVHHFYKYVSGAVLKRPTWFFDVLQQGEGIVDVTTHLVDLIQWECFPDQKIDYIKDIEIIQARRWPTRIDPSGFREVTSVQAFPQFLMKNVKDSMLNVYANGELHYRIRGISAKVSVRWNYRAPEGTGDTHFSVLRGTKANLTIRQGPEQNYKPVLYIEPVGNKPSEFSQQISLSVKKIQTLYPGIDLKEYPSGWEVIIPDKYKIGHEEHFAQVMERFLQYMNDGKLPDWEVPNMLAKYYTTAKALEMALRSTGE
jgi:predicted dehydrogenase